MYFGTGKELRGGRIQGLPKLPESINCQNPPIAKIARIAVIARIEKQEAAGSDFRISGGIEEDLKSGRPCRGLVYRSANNFETLD